MARHPSVIWLVAAACHALTEPPACAERKPSALEKLAVTASDSLDACKDGAGGLRTCAQVLQSLRPLVAKISAADDSAAALLLARTIDERLEPRHMPLVGYLVTLLELSAAEAEHCAASAELLNATISRSPLALPLAHSALAVAHLRCEEPALASEVAIRAAELPPVSVRRLTATRPYTQRLAAHGFVPHDLRHDELPPTASAEERAAWGAEAESAGRLARGDGRCDVDVRSSVDIDEFETRYALAGRPVVLPLAQVLRAPNRSAWSRDALVEHYGDRQVLIGPTSGVTRDQFSGGALGANGGGSERRSLRDFLLVDEPNADAKDPPYVYSTPRFDAFTRSLPELGETLRLDGVAASPDVFLAPTDHRRLLFLGGNGSGTFFHDHSHTFNLLMHGCKRWLLLPPNARDGLYAAPDFPTPVEWLRKREASAGGVGAGDAPPVLSCTQCGGQALFIPSGWRHAIINLGWSAGAAVEVGDPHLMALSRELGAAKP